MPLTILRSTGQVFHRINWYLIGIFSLLIRSMLCVLERKDNRDKVLFFQSHQEKILSIQFVTIGIDLVHLDDVVLIRLLEDGGEIGRGDHFLPYKFIERTIERWANFTKQLLIASRGHQAPRKADFSTTKFLFPHPSYSLWKEVTMHSSHLWNWNLCSTSGRKSM